MMLDSTAGTSEAEQRSGVSAGKRRSVSFVYVALGLIAAISIVLASTLIWFNFATGRASALTAGDELLNQIGAKIFERTRAVFDPLLEMSETVVLVPDIDSLPDLSPHPVSPFLISAIERYPQIQSAYLGFANGDFLMVSSLKSGPGAMRTALGAPDDARFAIRVLRAVPDGRRLSYWSFWDEQRRMVGSKLPGEDIFDPRKRPWYVAAMKSTESVVTDYYVFFTTGQVGVTIANRFDGNVSGVFGIDLDLSRVAAFLGQQLKTELSARLERQSDGLAAVFTKRGRVVAIANQDEARRSAVETERTPELATIESSGNPILKTLYTELANQGFPTQGDVRFDVGEHSYLGRVAPVPERYGHDTMIAIAVPVDAFLNPFLKVRSEGLLISIALVLAFLPVILVVARRISKPLRQLTQSAARINNFELDQPIRVASRISEVDELSETMRNMSSTLTTFGKYVPKTLVRNIVQSKLAPELGGERRDISVLFSDIQDFTPLSQQLEPEALMQKMSVYLHGMVEIIQARRGVVDKFVGDAVMAFWNAPEFDPDHIKHACISALECRAWTNAKNAEWQAAGEATLYTRFGLHSGPSIVGNVGSSDRMDYTVMGAPINLGARLEALNKFYGTQILVSQEIERACHDMFVFRHLDHAVPKGALESIQLFELVGASRADPGMPPEIVASDADRTRCDDWRHVLKVYEDREWQRAVTAIEAFLVDYPDDAIAKAYFARARRYRASPPPDDWDGVEVHLTKR